MKPFHESMRYEYDLTPDSVVVDVGGYEGRFANEIYRKYKCKVFCYEPVFCDTVRSNLDTGIIFCAAGLSGEAKKAIIHIKGDSTGQWADGDPVEVTLLDINKQHPTKVDLLKLNCEGSEFEILESIISRGTQSNFVNIQVQFHHVVPDAETRWQRIRDSLLETHELTYDAPWCWENYNLK